jgi:Co/Zn/Cd efflux system component
LSYQLPFERLTKLSRAASRKAYPAVWWLTWVLLALVFVAIMAISIYADALERLLQRVGIPFGPLFLLAAAGLVFLAGVYSCEGHGLPR